MLKVGSNVKVLDLPGTRSLEGYADYIGWTGKVIKTDSRIEGRMLVTIDLGSTVVIMWDWRLKEVNRTLENK